MLPALLTTLLWSYCVIAARQSIAQLGENAANVWRLLLAVLVMGTVAHLAGPHLASGAFWWFFLSGVVGFGLGDIGTFFALPRIGSRLTLLMAQCVAVPVAGLAEWLWLGTTISVVQILAVAVILSGIVMALYPEHDRSHPTHRRYVIGILFGLLAAGGQGLGAVLSRKAYLLHAVDSADAGVGDMMLLGATTGYHRLLGGMLIASAFWGCSRFLKAWQTFPEPARATEPLRDKIKYVALHAATGPILGVICFQWALATTPSAIVQPIVAMTPLAVMPFSYFLEGDRPKPRSILGAVVAVAGVVALALG